MISQNQIHIGDQIWMANNLNVDRFRNGDLIPEAKTDEEWILASLQEKPAWCYFQNNSNNAMKYGKLYNIHAINDPRGLAPSGWHIPTNKELEKLTVTIGERNDSGKKLKSKANWINNKNGTDEFGFNGIPLGYRGGYGFFFGSGYQARWWYREKGEVTQISYENSKMIQKTYETDEYVDTYMFIIDQNHKMYFNYENGGFGAPVRCIMN
jgi:uncharacterized protein (TIGR02145 family)